ncbi:otoancorin-like [Rhinatrema bivittatum]|uniref:otoancorin-like n=1 Tax=Rhinatrema bivittatum TaxID=194408 RepID=UPI00112ACAA2|nr:otoancorin-like [Rhinatrema bivittatum]
MSLFVSQPELLQVCFPTLLHIQNYIADLWRACWEKRTMERPSLSIALAVLLCYCCLLRSTEGQKQENFKEKNPCSVWETELKNQLNSSSTISSIIQKYQSDLMKLSERCVETFIIVPNVTALKILLKELNLVYDNLHPGTRQAVYKWIESIYSSTISKNTTTLNKNGSQEMEKGKDSKGSWITVDVLQLLDRFILQAPVSTLSGIAGTANSTLCQFYNSNTTLWSRLFDLNTAQARILIEGLSSKCNVNITNAKIIPSMGQLTCFYANLVNQMSSTAQQALMNSLANCSRNTKDVYQKILKMVPSQNLTADELKKLGTGAIGLSTKQIANISDSIISQSLEYFGKLQAWSKQQCKTIVKKVNVSEQDLAKMGSLIAGVSVSEFRKMKAENLLKALAVKDVSEATQVMSAAQKRSIVTTALKGGDIGKILNQLPENLIKEIPPSKLKDVNSSMAEEILKKCQTLNKAQALVLMKVVSLQKLNNTKAISDLKCGAKGLTCENIKQLSLDALGTLGNNTFLSRFQLQCAAKQFFKLMNDTKANFFSLLTQDELNKIPAPYLLYLPSSTELMKVPRALCPNILALLGQADIKCLGRSSNYRGELLNFMKSCLNLTDTKALTVEKASSLGSLVCTFSKTDIANLNASVFLGILDQFKTCGRFEGAMKQALRQKILDTFNAPSTWTQDTLKKLNVLAAVLSKEDLASLPNTEDIKMAILNIITPAGSSMEGSVVPEFDNRLDFKDLFEKVSIIYTSLATSGSMRKRSVDCTNVKGATADAINTLGEGNVAWTAAQLSCITDEDFTSSLETLANVQEFSDEQLSALKNRALQVYGNQLTKDQIASLKKITLALTEAEVMAFFNNTDIDMLTEISGYKEWADSNHKTRSQIIVRNFLSPGQTVANLSDTDLVGLGYFLCVFTPGQIQQISKVAYSTAAMAVGKLMCPDDEVLTALKNKAVEAFGSSSNWTKEMVQEVGTVAAGLSAAEIAQLPETVMPFLTPECIPLIPSSSFSTLSVSQLKSLGPENSLAVSTRQLSSLSPAQRDAVNQSSGSSSSPPPGSGSIRWTSSVNILLMGTLSLLVAFY